MWKKLPIPELRDHQIRFKDLLGQRFYTIFGNELLDVGLNLNMQTWNYHNFDIEVI